MGFLAEFLKEYLKTHKDIRIVKTTFEDYELARWLEAKDDTPISFYDYLHMSIACRLSAILVTRDIALMRKASELVIVKKPEELVG